MTPLGGVLPAIPTSGEGQSYEDLRSAAADPAETVPGPGHDSDTEVEVDAQVQVECESYYTCGCCSTTMVDEIAHEGKDHEQCGGLD